MDLEILFSALRWCLAAGLTTYAALRLAPRLPSTAEPLPVSEHVLRAALLTVLFMAWPVALLGALGWLSAPALLLFAGALAFVAWRCGAPGPRLPRLDTTTWPVVPTVPAAVLLAGDLFATLPKPPLSWDAMTYHLYFPARWLAAGRLVHVPTVFSDNSAAFAPQNGALFFTWHLALAGHDTLVNALQWGMLAFLALALYRLARGLGTPRQAAWMGAVTVFFLFPLRRYAPTANVDVFMVALLGGALAWLAATWCGERGAARGSWLFAALALGLAAGTKTVGLPLIAPLAVLLLVLLARRRRFAELGATGVALIAGGGFWYAKNWALYANPLFPLDWRLAGLHLAGAYDRAALRSSQFRLEFTAWLEALEVTWDSVAIALLLLGGLVLVAESARRRCWAPLALAALALGWTVFAAFVVPHNSHTRFLLPALVAALPGWSLLLGRLRGAWRGSLFLLVTLGATWQSRPDLSWRFVLDRLTAAGVSPEAWAVLFLAAGSAAAWSFWRARDRPAWTLAGWIAVLPLVALATGAGEQSRNAFLAVADFQLWRAGYLPFNDPAAPPTRIAYSGGNVPYALVGAGLRHFVVYCNTQGAPGDGFHDFWKRRGRQRYETYKPGLYRGPEDDYATWRACLEERNIEAVVLWRLLPVELPADWPRDGDFPVERRWMRQRPELFEPLLRTPDAEVYLLR